MATRDCPYRILDVFTDRPLAGNPLAVFPDAAGLDGPTMQAIAREMNLSETVFVTGREGGAHRLRIMTPATELPFAGHPTVGTAVALALEAGVAAGRVRLLEGVGPVDVTVSGVTGDAGHGRFDLPQAPARLARGPAAERSARLVGLDPAAVEAAPSAPQVWSAGVPFTIIGVGAEADLAAAALDIAAWRRELAGGPAPMVYVYWRRSDDRFAARMFAPGAGLAEDPATGAAAAAFAGLFAEELAGGDGEHRLTLEQGNYIGRPSRIELTVRRQGGRFAGAAVGGGAVRVAQGTLRLPA